MPEKGESTRALLLISFPHQLLHAIAAVEYDRERRSVPSDRPAVVLYWSHTSSDHARKSEMRAMLMRAVSSFPWITVLFPSYATRLIRLSPYRRVDSRAASIRGMKGVYGVDAIYFAHDASADHTAQALLQAFPDAHAVCFGDPPGFIFPTGRAPLVRGRAQAPSMKRRFWTRRLRHVQSWRQPDEYVVALDMSGLATQSNVTLLSREALFRTLVRIRAGLPEIAAAEAEVLRAAGFGASLLVISNLSGSGLMSAESELTLYVDICKEHAEPGSAVLLKRHAGSSDSFVQKLQEALRDFQVISLPEALQRKPLELFSNLLTYARVLSVSSSSALIAHLYGTHVVNVLTEERIRRYFFPEYVDYMSEASRAIDRAMRGSGPEVSL